MNWHYADKSKQVGPVSDGELQQLLQAGKINEETLVWNPEMTDWLPYRQAMGKALPPPLPSRQPASTAPTSNQHPQPKEGICAECGQYFPPDELIILNKASICARCKPLVLQRLAEGAATPGAAGLWRERRKLVTVSETPFPDRCIKCNQPANGFRLKRVIYWHNPAYYLLLLCNVLIYAIVAMIVRKKAVLHIGLCAAHRQQRKVAILVCWLGVLGGLGITISAGVTGRVGLAVVGVAGLLFGVIWGMVKGRTINATKIEGKDVWASGVCKEFLDELPER
jgi:hypothetical protein